MNAIFLGFVAAIGWGVYDFLIRFASRANSGLQSALIILVAGAVILFLAIAAKGEVLVPPAHPFWETALAGATYGIAVACGYRAFAIGPVTLVAPIISAYPVITTLWAVMNGSRPSISDVLGIFSVILGVALVARFAASHGSDETKAQSTAGSALLYATLCCIAFAVSFVSGQLASQQAPHLAVTFLGRLWAIATILPMVCLQGFSFAGAWASLPLLVTMAALDVISLLAVNFAATMDGAEYALVIASTFGAVTVTLAAIFLRERLSLPQLVGIVCVFGGVMFLSSRM